MRLDVASVPHCSPKATRYSQLGSNPPLHVAERGAVNRQGVSHLCCGLDARAPLSIVIRRVAFTVIRLDGTPAV